MDHLSNTQPEFPFLAQLDSVQDMATTVKTNSAITAELEQFYADAEATQDFADDALLDWLDGTFTGFETDQPRDPQQEVREPKPSPRKNPTERLRLARLHSSAGLCLSHEPHMVRKRMRPS